MMHPALFFHEYLITFGDEVQYYQGRSFNTAISVFVLNRYSTLVYRIASLVGLSDLSALSEEVSAHSRVETS